MEPVTNATVYVVDDDADVRDALAWLLRSRRLYSESFASAEDFLKMVEERALPRQPQCLLLDVRMTGISLNSATKCFNNAAPVGVQSSPLMSPL